MAGFRFATWLSLVLIVALAQGSAAQNPRNRKTQSADAAALPADKNGLICKIYSLADLSDDPNIGTWLADTIPSVIQAGTWSVQPRPMYAPAPATYLYPQSSVQPVMPSTIPYYQSVSDCKATLVYYAPAKMMVVNHTATVHGQIDLFLKNVKKSLPTNAKPMSPPLQAQYYVPTTPVSLPPVPASPAVNKSTAYPVPAPLQQPKHLFHLIVRYEGDGVIDANVADLFKSWNGITPAKDEPQDKPKPEAKSPSLSQLFNFIIRYEGDGIIDSNVVELMKAYITADKKSCEARRLVTPAPAQGWNAVPTNWAVPHGGTPFGPPPTLSPNGSRFMPNADASQLPAVPTISPPTLPERLPSKLQ